MSSLYQVVTIGRNKEANGAVKPGWKWAVYGVEFSNEAAAIQHARSLYGDDGPDGCVVVKISRVVSVEYSWMVFDGRINGRHEMPCDMGTLDAIQKDVAAYLQDSEGNVPVAEGV